MRFQDNTKRSRIVRACIVLTSTTALAACGALGGGSPTPGLVTAGVDVNGPQADFPVTIGDPYLLGGTTYRPADVLNYDEVGYLAAGTGIGYTGAHHTLPFPSYVEVTSLETGRTVLVRLEQRGPMNSNHLIALSPAALAQLDATPDTPVRVRRVNAPEAHRMLLRGGQAAPLRMDTPSGLVEVLRRRLPAEGSGSLRASLNSDAPALEAPVPVSATAPAPASAMASITAPGDTIVEPVGLRPLLPMEAAPLPNTVDEFADAFAAQAAVPTGPAPQVALDDGFMVQAAAFSSSDRASRAASALGGRVVPFGNLFRVRTGPFATLIEAEASLANVRAAGYSDARILSDG